MKTLLLCLLVIGLSSIGVAQIGGGSIVGFVTDPSNAPVTGVHVKAVNVATNVAQETVTNESGYYEFPLLPAGRYRLEAETQGFQKSVSSELPLNSGTRPRIDMKLKIGQVTESVEVVASAPLVNATTTDLGVVVTGQRVESLPLNGRNFQQLVGLQAGVVNSPSNSVGGRGGIEFNGSPAYGNNLLLDGVDMSFGENNASASDTAAGAGGGSLINTVSVEAIAEFKATGSAFSAEYGRATGGVLNVTTKSGGNQYHGTLFEFFRNDKLDANNFFSNSSGLVRPPLRWNQFGGNFGGPIIKDKLFFFFNYEGAIVRRAQQVTGNVATPELLRQVTPAIRQVLQTLPSDFTPTTNPLIGLSRRNDQRTNDENTYLSRGDYHTARHNIALRYSYNHQNYLEPVIQFNNPQQYPTRFHNAVFQDNFTLSPSMFNEFRLGFNRVDVNRINRDFFNMPPGFLNVAGVGLNASLPSYIHFTTSTYSLVDNFTFIRGKHTIKSGIEIRDVRSYRGQGGFPTHTYSSLPNLIADRSNSLQLIFSQAKKFLTTNTSFYVQDDWRMSSRIQFNLGVRYEYYSPLKGAYNIASSDPFGSFNKTQDEPIFAADRNNWGPRAGFVFDVLGNQKLILRAGAGISYAPAQPFFYYALSALDPRIPFNAQLLPEELPAGFSTAFPFPQSLIDRFSANPSLLPPTLILGRQIADYNRRDEYAGQWNLSLQYAVNPKLAVQAAYVGSRGDKLYATQVLNLPDAVTGQRPVPSIGEISYRSNSGRSSYHALQLSVNQRMTRNLTLDFFYTLAKNLTYGASDGTLTTDTNIQDQNDFRGSYGPKNGEVRNRFVHIHSYQIPIPGAWAGSKIARGAVGGWTIQGIMSWRSGLPVNVLSGVDFVGNRRIDGQRPDLVGGVDAYIANMDTLVYLNRAAFDNTAPTRAKRYGNLGFNALRGPSAFNYDGALHKTFALHEQHRLTFRFEMFNALNHTTFGLPNGTVTNPNFGRILSAGGARNIQLALKYAF